eukprot:634151-Prymnesium_polylepis.1
MRGVTRAGRRARKIPTPPSTAVWGAWPHEGDAPRASAPRARLEAAWWAVTRLSTVSSCRSSSSAVSRSVLRVASNSLRVARRAYP